MIANHLTIPLFQADELREVNMGRVEGLGYQEVIDL
jgi:hypothetical protein